MTLADQRFDESVRRALEKWPNVPNCFGWVSLNRRGQWLIKNELITHQRATQFIARNYASDEHGRWFIQNGPQRVFCHLDYTPHVFRLSVDHKISSHTGEKCQAILAVILDEKGNMLLDTNLGVGILDDRDLLAFCDQAIASSAIENSDSENHDLDESKYFDFNFVRDSNLNGGKLQISFASESLPMIAEFENQIAEKYRFTPNPEPLDDET